VTLSYFWVHNAAHFCFDPNCTLLYSTPGQKDAQQVEFDPKSISPSNILISSFSFFDLPVFCLSNINFYF
jgi:hypothetical protein